MLLFLEDERERNGFNFDALWLAFKPPKDKSKSRQIISHGVRIMTNMLASLASGA